MFCCAFHSHECVVLLLANPCYSYGATTEVYEPNDHSTDSDISKDAWQVIRGWVTRIEVLTYISKSFPHGSDGKSEISVSKVVRDEEVGRL